MTDRSRDEAGSRKETQSEVARPQRITAEPRLGFARHKTTLRSSSPRKHQEGLTERSLFASPCCSGREAISYSAGYRARR
jgi:hypothetical protein